MSEPESPAEHLDALSLARGLDNMGSADERARWDAHLAECQSCRAEVIEARRILATRSRRRLSLLVPLAAAAAVLLMVWPSVNRQRNTAPVMRDPALTAILSPEPVAPIGTVARADTIRWTAGPGVLRYRLTLFTSDGGVAWQTTTTDTSAALPDSLRLDAFTTYYWQVKAENSYGRWVESGLVAFTVAPRNRP